MKEFYTTKDGARILRDWGNEYEKHAKTATKAARAILPRLTIEAGSDFLGGLVYTSSSKIAALWNCNTSARATATRTDGARAYFCGVAIDDNGRAVYVWRIIDENGDEIGEEFSTMADEFKIILTVGAKFGILAREIMSEAGANVPHLFEMGAGLSSFTVYDEKHARTISDYIEKARIFICGGGV